MSLFIFARALPLVFATSAGAVTFHEVPGPCQRIFAEMLGPDVPADTVINWRPWIHHMRGLGYADKYLPKLVDRSADVTHLRQDVRETLGRADWDWPEGLTSRESAVLGQKLSQPRFPFEYLVHVAGFDAPGAARGLLEQEVGVDEERQLMVQTAPFWLTGHARSALATAYVDRIEASQNRVHAHRWLKSYFEASGDAPPPLRLHLEHEAAIYPLRHQEDLLIALDHLFLEELPEEDRLALQKNWLRLGAYPPLVDEGVAVDTFGKKWGGSCEKMSFFYLRLLLPPPLTKYLYQNIAPPPVVVRSKGRVIGLAKREGDPTMLGLRNVKNAAGHLVLMMGGVYRIPHVLCDRIRAQPLAGAWPSVEVNHLSVRSLGPVLNELAWVPQNLPLLLSFLEPFDRNQHQAMLRELAAETVRTTERPVVLHDMRARYHRRVWTTLLARWDKLRRRLETL